MQSHTVLTLVFFSGVEMQRHAKKACVGSFPLQLLRFVLVTLFPQAALHSTKLCVMPVILFLRPFIPNGTSVISDVIAKLLLFLLEIQLALR